MQEISFSSIGGIFPVFIFLVIAIMLVGVIRSLAEWNRNNHSPVLTVDATVAAKRSHTTQNMQDTGPDSAPIPVTSTSYYVTFQVQSGGRMEFVISGHEYGMLSEGDIGKLTFQGTRYLEFKRTQP